VYVVELMEHLSRRERVGARQSKKLRRAGSTLFTRLIADNSDVFDTYRRYDGKLYTRDFRRAASASACAGIETQSNQISPTQPRRNREDTKFTLSTPSCAKGTRPHCWSMAKFSS